MKLIATATIWTLGVLILLGIGIGIAVGWAWRDMQTIDFEPVYPGSPPIKIVAMQAELMRLGFYGGLNDGKCGALTLEAELRYLCALIEGGTFDTIWDGYVKGEQK